jgi:hypothetical protein
MRSSTIMRGAAVAAAFLCVARPAAAQLGGVNPLSFGASVGAAVPLGDASDAFNTGFSVDGIVGLRVPTLPVRFRAEVGYTRFGLKTGAFDDEDLDGGDVSGNTRFISGVANVIYSFPTGPVTVVRPYLIGGVGLYNSRSSVTANAGGVSFSANSGSSTNVGFNGGAGVEFPVGGLSVFGEVRYVSVLTEGSSTNFVPIRLGVRLF